MPNRKQFEASDIGGNLLPILTEGLYRDPLDALREYIQNAIDAGSDDISISITPRTVSITDNGTGMNRETADEAIKLGVSPKSPITDIGFRGIGIYSGYNLAKRIEIYSKTQTNQVGSLLTFNFEKMREMLEAEEIARAEGNPPQLFLEELLTETVDVTDDTEGVITDHGTVVILSGIIDLVSKRINNYHEVKSYLQSTVPLPFEPEFIFSRFLTSELSKYDYSPILINLSLGGKKEILYKPYYSTMFVEGGEYEPDVHRISNEDTGEHYGVVWVVYNDARKVLRDTKLRGILVTKKGFTISNREYLGQYFARSVLYKRLTGEVIIQNDNLRPNAARSDFESNDTRRDFLFSFQKVIKSIVQTGDDLQKRMKAEEVLESVWQSTLRINKELTSITRDIEKLLLANTMLVSNSKDLDNHPYAKELDPDLYEKTRNLIEVNLEYIRETIESNKKSTTSEHKRKESVLKARKEAEKEKTKEQIEKSPFSILELIEMLGISNVDQIKIVIKFIDDNILKPRLEETEYLEEINSLREYLEEVL